MMIGNPSIFAIESEITQASDRPSQMALGFFVLYIMGRVYGIRKPNATTLGVSFNEVGRRIAGRGSHNLTMLANAEPGKIASAFRRAVYGECEEGEQFFGMTTSQFRNAIRLNHLVWAPDGDEAFDDGSYVLQFEANDQVRLVAFVGTPDFLYDATSLRDCRLSQEVFYKTLKDWHDAFYDDWRCLVSKLSGPGETL